MPAPWSTGSGVVFDAAYTSVSSCSPSRASILSGIPTHQNGMFGLAQENMHFSAFAGLQSLPNVLNRAGVCARTDQCTMWVGSHGDGLLRVADSCAHNRLFVWA